MSDEFEYDVFLSHANADKAAVRELALRLKRDGLRVWLIPKLEGGRLNSIFIPHPPAFIPPKYLPGSKDDST